MIFLYIGKKDAKVQQNRVLHHLKVRFFIAFLIESGMGHASHKGFAEAKEATKRVAEDAQVDGRIGQKKGERN